MSILHIPPVENRKWTQPNMGDLLGMLWASLNLDLTTKPGKVLVSPLTHSYFTDTDDADLVDPFAAVRTKASGTDQWWYATNGVLFKSNGTSPLATIAQDAIANTPTDLTYAASDLVEHEGSLIASKTTDLYKLTAGTWTATWWTGAGNLNQAALVNTKPHPMDVFNRVLMIADGNYLHTVDRNNLVANRRITLPPEFEIRWIRHNVDRVWIGAVNLYGRNAEVFEWDGYTETYNRRHSLIGDITFSGVVKDGVVYTVTNAGLLMKHNGSTFSEEARFPLYNENIYYDSNFGSFPPAWQDYSVHKNGMEIIDNKVHILLGASISTSINLMFPNMKSGVWCYDENVGLYNRFGISKMVGTTQKDYSTGTIYRPGFLVSVSKQYGKFILGARLVTTGNGDVMHGLFSPDTGGTYQKRGYFITTQIHTSNTREEWEKVWGKFRRVKNTGDVMIIKKRSADSEDVQLPFSSLIRWSGTAGTTFTASGNWGLASVGDEVEITNGDGSGTTAHIVSITLVSTTYTVVLDESVGTVTNLSYGWAQVSDWSKLKTFSGTPPTVDQKSIGENSPYIQLKVELRGKYDEPELFGLVVATQTNIDPVS